MFGNPTKAQREAWALEYRKLESPPIAICVAKDNNIVVLYLPRCIVDTSPLALQAQILGSKCCKDGQGSVLLPYDADVFRAYSIWLTTGRIDVSYDDLPADALKKRKVELTRLHKAQELAKELGDDAYFKAADAAYDQKIGFIHTQLVYAQATKQAIDKGVAHIKSGIAVLMERIDRLRKGIARVVSIAKGIASRANKTVKWLNKARPL